MVMAVSTLQSPTKKVNTKSLIHHLSGLCFNMYSECILKLKLLF